MTKIAGIEGWVCEECGQWIPNFEKHGHKPGKDLLTTENPRRLKPMRQYPTTAMTQWKARIRRDTNRLIQNGILLHSGCCENCGVSAEEVNVEVHHLSYVVPDKVMFLCRTCHMAWHKTHEDPPTPSQEWVQTWHENYQSYPKEVTECTSEAQTMEITLPPLPSPST